MKTYLIIALSFFLLSYQAFSADEIEIKTKIKKVNVFLSGAQVNRTATVSVKSGTHTYIIKGLTENIDPNSIQIKGKGSFTIIGVNNQKNYLSASPITKEIRNINDSIKTYSKWLENNTQMLNVYSEEKNMILQNKVLKGNNTSLNPDDLQKLADFYRVRIKDINFKTLEINRKNKKYSSRVLKLNQQINQINRSYAKNTSEILLTLSSKSSLQGKLDISYKVYNAGWIPSYDIRSTSKDKGIEITYKANIYQSTGNDWKNVKLTLSTGNLSQNNTKPQLSPWYIQYYNQYKSKKRYSRAKMAPKSIVNSVGISDELSVKEENKKYSKSLASFTETVTSMVNTEFKISLPFSLESTGKGQLIEIANYDLPAQYRYYAVPKLDKNAFLIARITGWEELYMLPGEISLYNQGAYVGKSYIDPTQSIDTLEVSLGRDQFITFERKMIKDYNKNILIGTDRRIQKGYEIKVRNSKSTDIELIVMDQIPLTTLSEIKVKLENSSGAKYNENNGFLTWKMKLKPQEKKNLKFKFSVKYPKDKTISNL